MNIRGGYSILDFGGGDGALSYSLAKSLHTDGRSVNITVVDYNKTLVSSDTASINLQHTDRLSDIKDGQKFNLIVASAILEHLPNLNSDWNTLTNLLNDGGLLYVRTPYAYPLWRVLHKFGVELDMLFPEHIWDLGEDFFKNLQTEKLRLVVSRPSIPASSFHSDFWSALTANLMKAPWWLCHSWKYVGGWECVYRNEGNI